MLAAGMIAGLGLAIASALSVTRPMARIEAAMEAKRAQQEEWARLRRKAEDAIKHASISMMHTDDEQLRRIEAARVKAEAERVAREVFEAERKKAEDKEWEAEGLRRQRVEAERRRNETVARDRMEA